MFSPNPVSGIWLKRKTRIKEIITAAREMNRLKILYSRSFPGGSAKRRNPPIRGRNKIIVNIPIDNSGYSY
jgi:hypothetical protein